MSKKIALTTTRRSRGHHDARGTAGAAVPGAALSAVPPADPAAGVEYDALRGMLFDAYRFVLDAYPEDHRVRRRFESVLQPAIDDFAHDFGQMAALRDWFYALPPRELRRVFNGWPSDGGKPGPAEMSRRDGAHPALADVIQIVELAGDAGEMRAHLSAECDGHRGPARLYFRQGCRKDQAVAFLRAALAYVQLAWDDALDAAAAGEPLPTLKVYEAVGK